MPKQIQHFLFPANPDATIDQENVVEILNPYLGMISEAIGAAFSEFLTDASPNLRRKLAPSTRGQVVTNLIWEAVRDMLTGADEDVVFCDKLGFFKVIFRDRIILRFKRLNADRLAASQNSVQAVDWFSNRPVIGVPDHLLRVNFGYRPESNWATCSQFFLTHQRSFKTLDWCTQFELVNSVDTTDELSPSAPRGPEIKIISREASYRNPRDDS